MTATGATNTLRVDRSSHARGDATALSDVDLYAIGTGPDYALRVVDGIVFSISWRTEPQEREALRQTALVGTVIPGWRGARILHDTAGIAGALQAEAVAFKWAPIADECDAWVASQITGYAEEVLKLVSRPPARPMPSRPTAATGSLGSSASAAARLWHSDWVARAVRR